jgi:ubiquinone/menaquinone biosynthesis C-methylase UbiE
MDDPRIDRIVEAYGTACLEDPAAYSPVNHTFARADVALLSCEVMLLFGKAFAAAGWDPETINGKRLLEVGCAWGLRLQQLLGFNLRPQNLYGIDLQAKWIEHARTTNPAIHWDVMSATSLSHPDRSFDAAFAVMALSAMLDPAVVDAALAEMCRVSREFVLVVDNFDPAYENRGRGAVFLKGIDAAHIERLAQRSDVAEVRLLGKLWTTRPWAWRLAARLERIGLGSVAYAVAVRMLAPHSHRCYLVRLRS